MAPSGVTYSPRTAARREAIVARAYHGAGGWTDAIRLASAGLLPCEFSAFGAPKPYFYFENGELRPDNQPVPPPQPVAQDTFRRMWGRVNARSRLFDSSASTR
jgi:hypothetical protein